MISVTKIFRFEYAHRLPFYNGECNRLHGHSGKLEVEVTADGLVGGGHDRGMVVDFRKLSELVEKEVIQLLDHSCLNDYSSNPTCEIMLSWIVDRLRAPLRDAGLALVSLRMWETETTFATWRPD